MMNYFVTARKIRRILRFIQKRQMRVSVRYEINTSVGMYDRRKYEGQIQSYEVTRDEDSSEYAVDITFHGGLKMHEYLAGDWFFMKAQDVNGCVAAVCNDGPYNYFIIELV